MEKVRKLGQYQNGNYLVIVFDDGTKIRYNKKDSLVPSTIESMDIKITNYCDNGCLMCHENSSIDGKHGDILGPSFLDNLHPYTELAIGGGNPLSHPDLDSFLVKCKERKFIPSMTISQNHFMKNYNRIMNLIDDKLIYGLGVSFSYIDDEFISAFKLIPNGVLHVINGIILPFQLEYLSNKDLKILILGYKDFGRGHMMLEKQEESIEFIQKQTKDILPTIIRDKWFKVVSFDNLAIKQLDVKYILSKKEWDEFYMGDDGQYTMYVDMVNRIFSKSSTSPIEERYPLMDTVEEMLNKLKENQKNG